MRQEQIEKILGRTLTSDEQKSFEAHIKIAIEKLERLLCFRFCGESGERLYPVRFGFRSQYLDPFSSVLSVKLDGKEIKEFTLRFNESYNSSIFNCLEFKQALDGEILTVEADWGFENMPLNLQVLVAKMFELNIKESELGSSNIKSKRIEDFSVTYKDSSLLDEFIENNRETIDYYSLCTVGNTIRSGDVRRLL